MCWHVGVLYLISWPSLHINGDWSVLSHHIKGKNVSRVFGTDGNSSVIEPLCTEYLGSILKVKVQLDSIELAINMENS